MMMILILYVLRWLLRDIAMSSIGAADREAAGLAGLQLQGFKIFTSFVGRSPYVSSIRCCMRVAFIFYPVFR